MTTTLPNGTRVPDVASTSWAGDLEVNWQLLDAAIGAIGSNVQTNRPNTWTAEQTFSEPIIGNLTGTASKAGADEDGTSIKTGYVNIAGNQTVSGQKTWTGENLYTNNLNVSGFRIRLYDSTDDWTVTPTNAVIKEIDFTDKNNSVISYFAFQHRSNTTEPFRTCWRQNKKDGTTDYYSVNFNNLGEFYPEISNTKLGTSSYQWSAVYAQTYYYNGTAWGLDKANTWTGNNTYTKYQNIIIAGTEIGVAPNNQNRNGLLFQDKNNETLGWMRSAYDPSGDLSIEMLVSNKYSNGALDPNGTQIYQGIKQTLTASGDSYFSWSGRLNTNVVPRTNNSFDLGTSTNKWKTINGYEPSALGEVYVANEVNIDTTNWLLDGSGWNTLDTSIMSGWVYFAVADCDADSFILFRRGTNKAKNPTICFHPQHANSGTYYLYGLFMVPKNTTCIVAIKTGTNGILSQALLYPCFGNV